MNYRGFGALCASYAFLNTTRFFQGNPETYELLSGIPFGVKHCAGDPHRMLSPFIEPCFRVESTAYKLGYSATHIQFADSSGVISYITGLPTNSRIMIGPVYMGYLSQLPQKLYYIGQSHYFSITLRSNNYFVATDSESTICFSCDRKSLMQILSVKCIPESNGLINIWQFHKADYSLPPNEYKHAILRTAIENMRNAEDAGQGSQAYIACIGDLGVSDPADWGLRLFFEINFIIQRKHLFSNQLCKWGLDCANRVLILQLELLYILRERALKKEPVNEKIFLQVSAYEKDLAQVLNDLLEREVVV
jgi:hypothetical protein